MTLLAIDRALASLPRDFPRRFAPHDLDLNEWPALEAQFARLDRRIDDPGVDLEAWLLDVSELAGVVSQEQARRHVRTTLDTENEPVRGEYLHYQRHIIPKQKPRWHALERRLAGHPGRSALPNARYGLLLRDLDNQIALFRAANVERERQIEELSLAYAKATGALQVEFQGRRFTQKQMGRFQDERDRALREAAWRATATAHMAQAGELEDLFDAQMPLRTACAAEAGFDNFRDYAHRRKNRFDYSPEDCGRFHEAIAAELIPVLATLRQERRRALGVDTLRPWDLSVPVDDRPSPRPFETIDDLLEKACALFSRLDADLGLQFRFLVDHGLLDLENRPGKAPGGYNCPIEEHRVPFIFGHVVGRDDDLRLLLHEAGHAFHTLHARKEPLIHYRHAPLEFCEVASFSMEFLGGMEIGAFYEDEADRARHTRERIERSFNTMAWVAVIDGFQHWLYTNPGHSRAQRRAFFQDHVRRFDPEIDWSGLEDFAATRWIRQQHIVRNPFYYIEYGLAKLGAFQVWFGALEDRETALARYRAALGLGDTRPLPELYHAAGARFEWGGDFVRGIVRQALAAMPG